MSRVCIVQWESGTNAPAEARLKSIAKAFGVSVSDFYRGPVQTRRSAAEG